MQICEHVLCYVPSCNDCTILGAKCNAKKGFEDRDIELHVRVSDAGTAEMIAAHYIQQHFRYCKAGLDCSPAAHWISAIEMQGELQVL